MKKIAIMFLSATILSNIAFAEEDRVIATYKGGDVKESQVMQLLKPDLDNQPNIKNKKFQEFDKNTQEAFVRAYIQFKLLDQEVKTSGIESSKDFQDKLNTAKEQILRQMVLENQTKSIDDKVVDAKYSELVASLKGKKEIKVSHILFDNSPQGEAKAKDVKKRLNKGEKFVNLAKEFSKDEGSKATGGEIGYIREGQLVPEFESKAFTMKVNEISEPVKTQFGYHIIKVSDIRDIKVPTKEEVKSNIIARLKNEAIEKYMTDLMSKADVKITLPAIESKDQNAKPEATKPEPKK